MTFITMPTLPSMGDFGSQIQQYASALSIATINKKDLVFPYFVNTLKNSHGFRIAKALDINIKYLDDTKEYEAFELKGYKGSVVDTRLFSLEPDNNYILSGRFDTYRYWYDYIKDTILEHIRFTNSINQEAATILKNIQSYTNKPIVSLHARKGDYTNSTHISVYCQLEKDYYEKAIESIGEKNCIFLIFSNDIEWCKSNLNDISSNIIYAENNNDYVDMCLMSKCDHNIIANSSFSWWAAFLNKNTNKKIACPKNYLQNNHYLSKDINGKYYPEEWNAIDNK